MAETQRQRQSADTWLLQESQSTELELEDQSKKKKQKIGDKVREEWEFTDDKSHPRYN
jgi:hypothetical protein